MIISVNFKVIMPGKTIMGTTGMIYRLGLINSLPCTFTRFNFSSSGSEETSVKAALCMTAVASRHASLS